LSALGLFAGLLPSLAICALTASPENQILVDNRPAQFQRQKDHDLRISPTLAVAAIMLSSSAVTNAKASGLHGADIR
jgi:hypothetical protein